MSQTLYDRGFKHNTSLCNFISSKNKYKQLYYNRRRDQSFLFKEKGLEDPKEEVKAAPETAEAPLANKQIKDEDNNPK
tara:strand:+ start:156 stop:389 length:234 start_codon:yes stop_codon:yes gene_type:complete